MQNHTDGAPKRQELLEGAGEPDAEKKARGKPPNLTTGQDAKPAHSPYVFLEGQAPNSQVIRSCLAWQDLGWELLEGYERFNIPEVAGRILRRAVMKCIQERSMKVRFKNKKCLQVLARTQREEVGTNLRWLHEHGLANVEESDTTNAITITLNVGNWNATEVITQDEVQAAWRKVRVDSDPRQLLIYGIVAEPDNLASASAEVSIENALARLEDAPEASVTPTLLPISNPLEEEEEEDQEEEALRSGEGNKDLRAGVLKILTPDEQERFMEYWDKQINQWPEKVRAALAEFPGEKSKWEKKAVQMTNPGAVLRNLMNLAKKQSQPKS